MEWHWVYLAVGFCIFFVAVISGALTMSGGIARRTCAALVFIVLWPAFMVLYAGDFIDYWRKPKVKRR